MKTNDSDNLQTLPEELEKLLKEFEQFLDNDFPEKKED